MKINLYSIWDNLAKQHIRYYTSTNNETSLREADNFILDLIQRSPKIDLENFSIINQGELNTEEEHANIVINLKDRFNHIMKETEETK